MSNDSHLEEIAHPITWRPVINIGGYVVSVGTRDEENARIPEQIRDNCVKRSFLQTLANPHDSSLCDIEGCHKTGTDVVNILGAFCSSKTRKSVAHPISEQMSHVDKQLLPSESSSKTRPARRPASLCEALVNPDCLIDRFDRNPN